MGSVHISCLQLNGRTLATHWGLVFKRRFYSLMSGYQAGEWRYSVGRLLLENVVEWCISEKINVFDLTVGDESYKFDWTDNEYPYPSPAEAFHVRAPGVDYFDRYATALQPCRSEIIAKLSCDLPIVFAPMIGYRAALYLRKSRVVFAGRHAISASRRRIQTSGLCPDLSTLERAKDYDEATSQDFSLGFLLQVCSPLIWEQYK
jgi:hypothetical protein